MFTAIHDYCLGILVNQIQTRQFPSGTLLFPVPGLAMVKGYRKHVLLLPNGWLNAQKEGKWKTETKGETGKHYYYYIFFHLVAFVLIYMWILVGNNVHSLNSSVNKHPFVGMLPKSKQWGTWAVSPRTSVWDSEERVWKLQVTLQIFQLSCYSPPPPAPGSSHSPPRFVWGIWRGWQRHSNRLQPWTWGWTSGVKVQPRRGLGHLGIETNIWICIVSHVIVSLASDSWIRFNFKYKGV